MIFEMTDSVLTITMNPTVDKSCAVPQLVPEKKLRCSPPLYEPGGGGINVARGVSRLGVSVSALFTSGGRNGALLESLLRRENVAILPIDVVPETRENLIVLETSSNQQYRFGMPGETLAAGESDAVLNCLIAIMPFPQWVVISGSLPPPLGATYLTQLMKVAKAKGARLIVDTSGSALKAAVEEGVFLLKPNLGELGSLAGIEALDNTLAEQMARKLITEGKAEVVAVSMGAQGALLVTRDDRFYVNAPTVKKRSTVGAGDSMVAGMVATLAQGGSWQQMIHRGVACGTAATMNAGTTLFCKDDADRLYRWLEQSS